MKINTVTAYTFDDVNILPKYSNIKSRSDINVAMLFTKHHMIDVPIVASPMDTVVGEVMMKKMFDLGGVAVLPRFAPIEERVEIVERVKGYMENYRLESTVLGIIPRFNVDVLCVAIGVTGDYLSDAEKLLKAGTTVILIDVAHGNTEYVKNTISSLRALPYTFDIIAGNVATEEGALNLKDWGVDGIRCGIGGGSRCTTRTNTGVGVPMITSIMQCCVGVPVMADGGMSTPGDICKAFGCGANNIMLGNMLAGTDECPVPIEIDNDGNRFKSYKGSASYSNKVSRGEIGNFVEGVSKSVVYKGPVSLVIGSILDGVKSSCSYVGVDELRKMSENTEFVIVTNNGVIEAGIK